MTLSKVRFNLTHNKLFMRFPIKFNRTSLPSILKILPNQCDPRKLLLKNFLLDDFESSISAIKADNIWKTTKRNRHVISDQLIRNKLSHFINPVILEVGASSGTASLDLIKSTYNSINKFYITDLSFSIRYIVKDDKTYFYHPVSKKCVMCVSDRWIFYNDSSNSTYPLGAIIKKIFTKAPSYDPGSLGNLSLIHPTIKEIALNDKRIIVREFDIFEEWELQKVDLIKVANVLNLTYFSEKLIRKAVINLKRALKKGGYLIITESRKNERVSIFKLTDSGAFTLVENVNSGCQIEQIINEK